MDSKNKGIIVVAVVIVLIVAVFAAQALNDKNKKEDKDETDTYYFYLDGMDSNNGWYSADADNIADAFNEALKNVKLTITLSDAGWVTIDEYPGTYDSATGTGFGLGIFGYISNDVSQPDASYFVAGPSVTKVSSNIIYISYGAYSFNEDWSTNYDVNPTTSTEWMTTGPFAAGSSYEPLGFETYYFYLDGMDSNNGWYSADADNIADAFNEALKNVKLTITLSDAGWVTIDEYPGTYDSATGTGFGLGIFGYISNDVSQPDASYFVAGPSVTKVSSNIIYISYGAYSFNEDWSTNYDVNPTTSTEWMTTGPFAA